MAATNFFSGFSNNTSGHKGSRIHWRLRLALGGFFLMNRQSGEQIGLKF